MRLREVAPCCVIMELHDVVQAYSHTRGGGGAHYHAQAVLWPCGVDWVSETQDIRVIPVPSLPTARSITRVIGWSEQPSFVAPRFSCPSVDRAKVASYELSFRDN